MNWMKTIKEIVVTVGVFVLIVLNYNFNKKIDVKDAHIEFLRDEIEHLRQITPDKLLKYYLASNELIEEYYAKLKSNLVAEKRRNEELRATGDLQSQELAQSKETINQLQKN